MVRQWLRTLVFGLVGPCSGMASLRVAIVTGGSSGIGLTVGRALAKSGFGVVLAARRADVLATVRESLATEGVEVLDAIAADVCDEASVASLFDSVLESWPHPWSEANKERGRRHGALDLLVNSAGVMAGGSTVDLSVETFRRSLDVNIVGTFACSQAAFRRMKRGGRIINVGSIAALAPRPDSAAYTTSKFAIQGLTKSLALDGRKLGIAVGAIHPGNVETPMLTAEEAERRRAAEGLLDPEDVARTVDFMASLPLTANILELTVIPTIQPLVGRG